MEEKRFTVQQSESGRSWVVMKDGQAFASFGWNSDPRGDAERMAASFNEDAREAETARLFAKLGKGA